MYAFEWRQMESIHTCVCCHHLQYHRRIDFISFSLRDKHAMTLRLSCNIDGWTRGVLPFHLVWRIRFSLGRRKMCAIVFMTRFTWWCRAHQHPCSVDSFVTFSISIKFGIFIIVSLLINISTQIASSMNRRTVTQHPAHTQAWYCNSNWQNDNFN